MQDKSDDFDGKMAFTERLEMIDHELRLLHKFCKDTGYSSQKIKEFAQPFFQEKQNFQKRNKYVWIIAISVVLCSALMICLYSHPVGQAVLKLSLNKVFPLYKWINLKKDSCLIRNPLFIDQYLTEEDCKVCSDIEEVKKANDLTKNEFVERYMKIGQHVIVKDGMKDWPHSKKQLNIEKLKKTYLSDPSFYSDEPCDTQSNLNFNTVKGFMENDPKEGFFMSWTNCIKQAAKAMRRFYSRPYFLPTSVEMFEQNYVYFTRKYRGEHFIEYKTETAVLIVFQIKGSSSVSLYPEELCKDKCLFIDDVLQEGDVLVAMNTHTVWNLEIQGTGEDENIVIAVEGNYN